MGVFLIIFHADTDDLANPLGGGAPVRTFEINKRLAARHKITVLTAMFPRAQREETKADILYLRLGMQIYPFGLSPHLTYLARLRPYLKAHNHDLVIEEFMPPLGFCGLPWATNKPVISLVQWYFFEFWEKKYHLPFQRWMKKIASLGRYQNFIVQSNCMGETIKHFLPNAVIAKIPCGIHATSFATPDQTIFGDFVLFLGRLDIWQKGLDTLLEAWKIFCANANIKLIVAGSGPAQKQLEDEVTKANLHHLISFCGSVHGEAKRDLLQKCRFLVMPSREETFGLVALEAMAAGKAVVAFDIDHLNELLRPHWAELIKQYNPEQLGQTICRLWEDIDRCQKLGREGLKQAANYSWDILAEQQEQFYQDILRTKKT